MNIRISKYEMIQSQTEKKNKKMITWIDNISMQLSNGARHTLSGQQHLAQIR